MSDYYVRGPSPGSAGTEAPQLSQNYTEFRYLILRRYLRTPKEWNNTALRFQLITSVQTAREWRTKQFERSSANPARSVDFVPVSVGGGTVVGGDSDSSESLSAEDSDSDSVATDDDDIDSDNAIEAISSQPLCLHKRSRNLSGAHSICPQLMDLCLAGVDCWGKFWTSFRPFETKRLNFEPIGGDLSHDEYLRLVLSIYKRYHKTALPRGTSNSAMLERLRQVVGREKSHRQ